ncbi:restriction endonuclease subunit S [Escherichia coli]|uniref:restriction endonuclease subunit S n=2 Tax=Escherichia coli TaxID=562 RepID=UPI000BE45483|nr:restriction endonuclease subunit S [Escherichia coli]EFK5170725.1 restriction endonuclease subunit S [Escherichia coli]
MAREIILQKLPVGWSYNLLDNIAERCSGHTPSKSFPEYWNGGIKWISLADSCRLDKGYVYETDKEISLEGIKNSSAEVHPAETVVLSRDAGVGKSGVMATPMAVSQHFIAWKCDNKEKLHSWYLYNWLQLNKEEFERQAVGSTIKTIGLPYFKKLRIAVPPFDEQKKIAQILSTWDKAISVTEKLLTNSQQQKKALMQQLLTGKKRLLDENGVRFSGEWEKGKFCDMANIDTGYAFKSKDFTQSDSGIPIIRMSDFKTGGLDVLGAAKVDRDSVNGLDKFKLRVGDFVFGMSGSLNNYGRVETKDLPCYLNQRVGRILAKECANQAFITYLYLSDSIQQSILDKAAGAAQLNISISDLRSMVVYYPCIEEQQKIAAVLSAADAEISTLEKKLACLRDEKKALMQQLLTGKRRVKVDEAVAE